MGRILVERYDAHMTAGELPFASVDPAHLIALMDQFGITRATLSPSDRQLAVDNHEGNDLVCAWRNAWPERFWGFAVANPWYGARAVAELTRALDAGLSAIKLHPARQGFVLLEPVLTPIIELAERRGVPVYVVTGVPIASMPLQLVELARRYPGVQFIMGRSGRTDFSIDFLPSLRMAPNIYAETAYNLPGTVAALIAAIGVERILFASDAPFTNLELELAKLERVNLEPAERALLMGGNLARLFGEGQQHAHN
jgi:predicted TIM-barrel fold metal-dependent hydrolase